MLEDWPHVNQAQLHDALSYYYDHQAESDELIYRNSYEGSRRWMEENWTPEQLARIHFEREDRTPIRERMKHGT